MPTFAVILLAVISLLAGALVEPPVAKAAKRKPVAPPQSTAVAPENDGKIGYRIVSEDISVETSTRYVATVLSHRIAEAEIAGIADVVRGKEKAPFEKTIVNFYLPGMKIGAGAWAIATYQPSLKVTIVGLRLDEEQAAIAEASADRRTLVGVWLTAPPAAPGRLTIYREGTKTFAEWRLRNGAKSVEEVVESRDGRGRRLTPAAGSTDYYLIGWGGELELRDSQTVIAVGERLAGFGDKSQSKSEAKTPATGKSAPHRVRQASGATAGTASGQSLSATVFKF